MTLEAEPYDLFQAPAPFPPFPRAFPLSRSVSSLPDEACHEKLVTCGTEKVGVTSNCLLTSRL